MLRTITIDDTKPATSTQVRKTSGSITVVIPAAIVSALGVTEGDTIEILQATTGEAVIKPAKAKRIRPRYSLAQLLAEMKDHVELPDLVRWQDMPPAGTEL